MKRRESCKIEYFFRSKGTSDGKAGGGVLWSESQKKRDCLLPIP